MTARVELAAPTLYWLPPADGFKAALASERHHSGCSDIARFRRLQSLASHDLDFLQTRELDRVLAGLAEQLPASVPRLRLALIGSSTLEHLVPGIRVAALRRGLWLDVHVGAFGQWRQEVLAPESALYRFGPDAVLLAVDHAALLPQLPLDVTATEAADAAARTADDLAALWRLLKDRAKAAVIQQTVYPDEPPVFGHLERLVPGAAASLAMQLDRSLVAHAAAERVLLLDLRLAAQAVGTRQILDVALWHHAKQAVSPAAAPWLGEQIGRVLAAIRGLSRKVLVLDLDNTLWGGTIGDDGLEGIVLGQGTAAGEAFAAFQRYVKRLAERGVVLAVSSKNDRQIAEQAFTGHPEMVLKLADFAAFEANWHDKPAAVARIAEELRLGLDAMVFADDNPAERALMRRTHPDVAVPELPDAPELFARCIADAGYFEAAGFTADDAQRAAQYAANRERRKVEARAVDMERFLRELEMTMTVAPFRPDDVPRIAQLINKTNQFNLTTRRYTEAEVRSMMQDPSILTLTARLADRFGDNGLTSIVIGRMASGTAPSAVEIDTWLMSCRVLGRGVEDAMLHVLVGAARAKGAPELIGRYRPTPKNGLVRDHYERLGFARLDTDPSGESRWSLPLQNPRLPQVDHINVVSAR